MPTHRLTARHLARLGLCHGKAMIVAMIRTNAAATMLGVSTNTLRSWERRYGFPHPRRSEGGHRQYPLEEIAALRHTLTETQNVSSAIALAQERGAGPSSSSRLAAAYRDFHTQEADRLLEESLAVRSLERTIDEVLLAGIATCVDPSGPTAEYEFGWRHAASWLAALGRSAPPPSRGETILLIDTAVPCDLDGLHAQGLEVLARRSGLRTFSLTPAVQLSRLGRALRALSPAALIVCGRGSSLDSLARLIYTARSMKPETLVFDFRGAVPDTRGSAVSRLGDSPMAARQGLLAALDGGHGTMASIR